jgi:hypothetical protein
VTARGALVVALLGVLLGACNENAVGAEPPPTDADGRPLCRVLAGYNHVGPVMVPYYRWVPCPTEPQP